jgi:predicted ATP-grasp superfamily ATP-dependent carboligase
MKKINILLTNAWSRTSYVALRSFAQNNLKVAVADEGRIGMCQFSRYKKGVYLYQSPFTQTERFIKDINSIITETGANFLLPGHDETTILAKYRDRLPDNIILPVANYEKLTLANDKYRSLNYAQEIGIPTPESYDYKQIDDLPVELNNKSVVIKLRNSNSSKGVFFSEKGQTFRQLEKIITDFDVSKDRLPVIQDIVEGEGWGVSCLYWEGKRIASFTHKRIKEKLVNGGTSTLRVSKKNELLENYAHHLLDSLEWHGLAMVEFKYNPDKNKGWLMEINPRLWGSIALAVASGVDFPMLTYIAATESCQEAKKKVKPWKEGIKAQWLIGYFVKYPDYIKKGRYKELLKFSELFQADVYDDFKLDDLGAFLGEALYYGVTLVRTRSTNPTVKGNVG